jgi:hypothetical protein
LCIESVRNRCSSNGTGQMSVCVLVLLSAPVLACASRVCWSEPLRDLARSCVVRERVHAAAFPPCTTWLLTIHQPSLHVMTCQAATQTSCPSAAEMQDSVYGLLRTLELSLLLPFHSAAPCLAPRYPRNKLLLMMYDQAA